MRVTAEIITDEQIRQLRASLPASPEVGSVNWGRARECEWALSRGQGFIPDAAIDDVHERRMLARARCAEILNARAVIETVVHEATEAELGQAMRLIARQVVERGPAGAEGDEKIKLRLDDESTRKTWETVQRAKQEVASWPAWKRGSDAE